MELPVRDHIYFWSMFLNACFRAWTELCDYRYSVLSDYSIFSWVFTGLIWVDRQCVILNPKHIDLSFKISQLTFFNGTPTAPYFFRWIIEFYASYHRKQLSPGKPPEIGLNGFWTDYHTIKPCTARYLTSEIFLLLSDRSTVKRCSRLGRTFLLACTWGGIHPERIEPSSPREKHGDILWVLSTPRSPVPVSLHLLAFHLKPSQSSLRAPEHSPFKPSLLVLIQGTQGIGV